MYPEVTILLLVVGLVVSTGPYSRAYTQVSNPSTPAPVKKVSEYSCRSLFTQCPSISNAYCNKDGKCECRWRYVEVDGQCKPGLNATCNPLAQPSECYPSSSTICSSTTKTCECKQDYYYHVHTCQQHASGVGYTCNHDLACQKYPNSECINNVCQCKWGYKQVRENCVADLYVPCESDSDCSEIPNSICETKTKRCSCEGWFFDYLGSCHKNHWGFNETCDTPFSCRGANMICFNHQCKCDWNYFENGGSCYAGLNAPCFRNEDCYGDTHCKGKNCVCKDNFQAYQGKCVAKTSTGK